MSAELRKLVIVFDDDGVATEEYVALDAAELKQRAADEQIEPEAPASEAVVDVADRGLVSRLSAGTASDADVQAALAMILGRGMPTVEPG